ncbi:MAG: hypothetical protein IT254_06140 [Chitinophagaceae bacterium]|nr:hypothetical protein [Chitinophagaceae bacterium]
MKLAISLIFFLTTFNTVSAQIEKRFWLIGGAASFSSTKNSSSALPNANQSVINLSGNIGYFVIDKLALGLKPGYENSTVKFASGSRSSNSSTFGPFVRYYFLPKEKTLNLIVEGAYQFGIVWTTSNETLYNNKFSIISGVTAFLNESVGLEFTLGYSTLKFTKASGTNKNTFAGIGFQFYLEKSKN